jgi:hypothetical protein
MKLFRGYAPPRGPPSVGPSTPNPLPWLSPAFSREPWAGDPGGEADRREAPRRGQVEVNVGFPGTIYFARIPI